MYLNHYQLDAKPFSLSPNPDFLWLGEKHEEALSTLKYGVTSDMGFLLMTGDVGVGKTALINRLTDTLDSSTIFAHVTDPGLGTYDFFRILANAFKIDTDVRNKADFLLDLEKFLRAAHKDGRRVLLIVDEAQRLTDKLLDEIRVLSNIELSHCKLINIFFVGQPEFIDLITAPRNRAIRQRIAINYHIHPLIEAEVGQYIEHRLKVAGANRQIFLPDSFREVYRITNGFPRAINILCDHALVEGYVSGSTVIDADAVRACERELDLRAGLAMPAPKRQPLPGSKPRPASEPVPPEAPRPSPLPQKASKRTVWVVGGAVIVAVLAGYYWLRIKPNWNVQSAPQTTIAQSSTPSTNPIAIQSIPPSSAVQDAAADPPASNAGDSQKKAVDPPAKKIASLPSPPQTVSEIPVNKGDASLAGPIGSADINNKTAALASPSEGVDSQMAPTVPTERPNSDRQPQTAESPPDATNAKKTAPTGPEAQTITDATEKADVTAADHQSKPAKTMDGSGSAVAAVQTELLSPSPSNPVKPVGPSSAEGPSARKANLQSTTQASPKQRQTTETALSTPAPSDDRAEAALAATATTAAAIEKARSAAMENRIRTFLQTYCNTYAAKNLDRFTTFFAANAMENGKPFAELTPKYKRNFSFIEAIQYRIELQDFSVLKNEQIINIDGNFILKWLPRGKQWRENSGTISMSLKDNGSSFLVQRLDYRGGGSKKK